MTNNLQTMSNSLNLLGNYSSDSDEAEDNVDKNNDLVKAFETNWTECVDKKTCHPYYWNPVTKEVTWEIPSEYEEYLKLRINSLDTSDIHQQWIICYTDENVPYFVNEFTRKVSWQVPDGHTEESIKKLTESSLNVKTKILTGNENVKVKATTERKRGKKNTKKVSKKYPFANDVEDEKIELITSYDVDETDTTSDDDVDQSEKKSSEKKQNLHLVASEYNSDNDNNVDRRKIIKKEEIIISTNQNDQIKDNIITSNNNNLNIQTIPVLSCQIPISSTTETSIQDSTSMVLPKSNTFASIITGGRSPDKLLDDLNLEFENNNNTEKELNSINSIVSENNKIDCEIDSKIFKRKRRIEFNTTDNKNSNSVVVHEDIDEDVNEEEKFSVSLNKNLYGNFQRGGTIEFSTNSKETSLIDMAIPTTTIPTVSSSLLNNFENNQDCGKIDDLKCEISAKLKFLCDGRPIVSAVQAINIQLETLIEAYNDNALLPNYIFKWLQSISTDLKTLEKDVAPSGWKCLWNRKKSQYYYKNLEDGTIQWEYPDQQEQQVTSEEQPQQQQQQQQPDTTSFSHQSVEMDISTTPPHNIDEEITDQHQEEPLLKRFKDSLGNDIKNPPDPPIWKSNPEILMVPPPPIISSEPLPPGIDPSEYDMVMPETKSETLNSALASFYSDLATIDDNSGTILCGDSEQSSASVTIISNDESNNKLITTVDGNGVAASSGIKKKKKKSKKIEPWRTGNLETYINKWQKAQKELLDG